MKAIDFDVMPGGLLIKKGLKDIVEQQITIHSCLIVIAFTKFKNAGLIDADKKPPFLDGEITLYNLLGEEPGDAFSKYNALLRQLVSFCHALNQVKNNAPHTE